MDSSHRPAPPVRFGDYELFAESGELKKLGARVRLSGQAFDTLVLLITAQGQIVSREQLQKALWSDSSFGDFEHGLNAAINRLRGVLGDSAIRPHYIETIPRRGYRFIHPLMQDSPTIATSDAPGTAMPVLTLPPPASLKRKSAYPVWAVIAFALAILGAAVWVYLPHPSSSDPVDVKEAPLTTLPGSEISPSFSPDGSQIAFGWDGENNGAGYDLYVQAVGAENPLRLTHQPVPSWTSTAWSPDGRFIAMRSEQGGAATIKLVPATGGPARPLTALHGRLFHTGLLSWSRDSKTIAYAEDFKNSLPGSVKAGLYLLSIDTQQPRWVETHCAVPVLPKFNPKQDSLAFGCFDRMDRSSIRSLDLGSGTVSPLIEIRGELRGLDWSADGRSLFYSYTDPDGGSFIWRVETAHPEHPSRLPLAHDAGDLTVSRSGDALAYVQASSSTNIWKLHLTPEPMAQSLLASTRTQNNPSISPDGSRIAFESDRGGSHEVWISDADGHNLQEITHLHSLTGTPSWSPDSKRLAFDSRAQGEANLYLYDTVGGDTRIVNTSTRNNSLPAWSNDGRFLYYTSGQDMDNPSIWRVSAEGGKASMIVADGELPAPSPDGTHLFFRRMHLGSINIMRARIDGSDPQTVEIPQVAHTSLAWCPSGNGLYLLSSTAGTGRIEYLDIATGKRNVIYTLPNRALEWIGGLSVSSDGKWLLFTQIDEQKSDLSLLTGLSSKRY
ncbi:MAG: winged helix-turn-helix domain-containing protein [Acidobacteriota bacterium]|nr:winged helix-turn-helix domain-containing protein [Acidobacteriota bacterium]